VLDVMSSFSSQENTRDLPYTRRDFDCLREIARERTGFVLSEDKFGMLYSRLFRRVRYLGLSSFKEYCKYLEKEEAERELLELANAITTNLTAFFRESHHFRFLSERVFPELMQRNSGSGKVRIWSAGCSTGEEPYSLSIALHESQLLSPGWDPRVLASDVDSGALALASKGVYPQERVGGMDVSRLHNWFLKGKGRRREFVCVKPEVRSLVDFSRVNLLENWVLPEPMDVIFCRNVIIYFDKSSKIRLLQRFADALKPGGYLFMGYSESLLRLTDRFELVGTTVYKKKG
jgi:chemotaxis protein methyltransferase CheR